MARKHQGSSVERKTSGPGKGSSVYPSKEFQFVNVYFNQSDQQYLRDNYEQAGSITWEWIGDIPDTYKLSCSLDKTSGRFNATLACSDPDDPNNGLILSVRGATRNAALFALAYADGIKFEGAWANRTDPIDSLFG